MLIHLGFCVSFVNWVINCVSSITFSILINGVASGFFRPKRGLRKGCPLSPLSFLVVVEGLSRRFLDVKRSGDFVGRVSMWEVLYSLLISYLWMISCVGTRFCIRL